MEILQDLPQLNRLAALFTISIWQESNSPFLQVPGLLMTSSLDEGLKYITNPWFAEASWEVMAGTQHHDLPALPVAAGITLMAPVAIWMWWSLRSVLSRSMKYEAASWCNVSKETVVLVPPLPAVPTTSDLRPSLCLSTKMVKDSSPEKTWGLFSLLTWCPHLKKDIVMLPVYTLSKECQDYFYITWCLINFFWGRSWVRKGWEMGN